MEDREKLDGYISKAYDRWVDYAKCHVRISKLQIAPEEVVNDVLCVLLERDAEKMERLMNISGNGGTELDFFVMRVIKINIYSPRSHVRYRRGPYFSASLDSQAHVMEPDNDPNEVHNLVGQILFEMKLSAREREIFAWKFFDGIPLSKWPGVESRGELYDIYNRIRKEVFVRVRKKLQA